MLLLMVVIVGLNWRIKAWLIIVVAAIIRIRCCVQGMIDTLIRLNWSSCVIFVLVMVVILMILTFAALAALKFFTANAALNERSNRKNSE